MIVLKHDEEKMGFEDKSISGYMLATDMGLVKVNHEFKEVQRFFLGESVKAIELVDKSIYVLGFCDNLIVWKEDTNQKMLSICKDWIISIRRLPDSKRFIVKTRHEGVKSLNLTDLNN